MLVHRSFQCEIWQQSSLSKMHVSGLCRLNDEPVTNDVSIWEHGMSSRESNDRTQHNKVEHLDAQSWRHAPILRAHVQPCNWIKDPYIKNTFLHPHIERWGKKLLERSLQELPSTV